MAKLLSGTRIYGNTTVDTQLFVNGSNASTSNTTGALIVTGGVGVSGNLYAANVVSLGTATATRLISTQATGTAPFEVSSNTVVTNLNADLLDGLNGTSYANATFAQAGFTTANSAYNKANSVNAFAVISVAGQDNIVATPDTTLNIAGSGGISVTTNTVTKTITITAASSATSLFVDGSDFGSISSTIIDTNDLGSIDGPTTVSLNLGELVVTGIITPTTLVLPTYSVSTLPSADPQGQMIFVFDESGGAVIAFSTGTHWRRVTDRAIVA